MIIGKLGKIFLSILNNHAPQKQIRVRDESYPWITQYIRLMTKRDKCLRKQLLRDVIQFGQIISE